MTTLHCDAAEHALDFILERADQDNLFVRLMGENLRVQINILRGIEALHPFIQGGPTVPAKAPRDVQY